MAIEQKTPKRPDSGYLLARAKQGVRYLWNRIAVAVAVKLILVLYALVRFLLKKCQGQEGPER